MGDACVNDNGGNPCLKVSVTQKDYLEHLHQIYGAMSRGVEFDRSAEELAEQNSERGFSTTVNVDNYNDVYMWHTVNHPELDEFREWYSDNGKKFPQSLELTPTAVKHWFACDGTLSHGRYIQIYTANGQKDMLADKFSSSFGINPNTKAEYYLYFTKEQTEQIFDIIGSPLPGFEYKWPDGYTS